MTKLPKAILFDADGTLYDSEPIHYEATRRTAHELHGFDFTRELYETHMLRGTKKGHEVLIDHGFDSDDGTYARHKQIHFEALVSENLQLTPGVLTFLEWCKDNKIVCVIVSSARNMQLQAALTGGGLRDFFSHIVAVEDVGSRRKPDPHPYILGLEKVGVKASDALAVEDTAKGISAANAAGLECIAVRNNDNTDEELRHALLIIDSFDELKTYLTSHK